MSIRNSILRNIFQFILWASLPALLYAQPSSCPPSTKTRVLLLGDSWTHIMWNNRTYKDVFDQFGHADKIERGDYTAIGGTTASYWKQPANIAIVMNELITHPDIDIVLISIGGNDFLAGINGSIPGWHTGLSATDETLLFDRIQADIQVIVDSIKLVRPNINIVFSGYDFLNLVETVINDATGPTALLWANLGQPTPAQINVALSKLKQRKINIANADPNIYYVHAMGLMQWVYGYPDPLPIAPFGTFLPYTTPYPGQSPPSFSPFPGGNTDYPSPPVALGSGGSDAIHLSDEGYKHLVVNQMQSYFLNKFRGHPNMSFASEGGTNDGWVRSDGAIGVSNIRVGDENSGDLYRGIFSFNTAAIPDNATITGASFYINRSGIGDVNPFTGSLGSPRVDIKSGTFGSASIEIADFLAAASAGDVGCFIGTAPKNGYTIRVDLKSSGYSQINKTGRTQFRIYFQNTNFGLDDYLEFNNGDQPGLLAPYLDVFYTTPPPPATADLTGDTSICEGNAANLKVTLTGTAPWSLTWSDGVVENNINNATHFRSVSPLVTTTYTINTVSDINGTGSASGSSEITVIPQPQVTFSGLDANYCVNSTVANITASPPGGILSGPGISGVTFNPTLAVNATGGGTITIIYSGTHNGCPYSENIQVYVDSNSCNLSESCSWDSVSGVMNCVGADTVIMTYPSSGRLYVFEDLIPGKTYIASTCSGCSYDTHLMVRDESSGTFMAENDDACDSLSSVSFVAPASGNIGINLTAKQSFPCNPYDCNPHDCNPYDCNPHQCNPYQCNCQTCYQTCTRDTLVYMTCYPGGTQVINGILTSDCIGACTGGFCWRWQYQVPYDCNPYQCNCQTCYQTCYDTCYQTCYDTCYQTCLDVCGSNNNIPCDVTLTCVDCTPPTSSIAVSNLTPCVGDSVNFSGNLTGLTCNSSFSWYFGTDAFPTTSSDANPSNIYWITPGNKKVMLTINEPGIGMSADSLQISVLDAPSGGTLTPITNVCSGETVTFILSGVTNATYYLWSAPGATLAGSGNSRDITFSHSTTVSVTASNGSCSGPTFTQPVAVLTPPTATITATGSTVVCQGDSVKLSANTGQDLTYQWQLDGVDILGAKDSVWKAFHSGSYSVIVTNDSGCTATSPSLPVIINSANVTITVVGSTSICTGDTVVLRADTATTLSYQWQKDGNDIPDATNSNYKAYQTGDYSVMITDQNSCMTLSNTIRVNDHPIPSAIISASVDTICEGENTTLSIPGGFSYQWSTGASSTSISVNPDITSSYHVTITDSFGCQNSDSITIVVFDNPPLPSISVNENTISTSNGFVSYQWYLNGAAISGANNASYTIQESGNYSVEVMDDNGCSTTSSEISLTWSGISTASESPLLKVYPNPTNDLVFIELAQNIHQTVKIELYNVIGEKTSSVVLKNSLSKCQLNLNGVAEGLYFLKIEFSGQVFSERIVKTQ